MLATGAGAAWHATGRRPAISRRYGAYCPQQCHARVALSSATPSLARPSPAACGDAEAPPPRHRGQVEGPHLAGGGPGGGRRRAQPRHAAAPPLGSRHQQAARPTRSVATQGSSAAGAARCRTSHPAPAAAASPRTMSSPSDGQREGAGWRGGRHEPAARSSERRQRPRRLRPRRTAGRPRGPCRCRTVGKSVQPRRRPPGRGGAGRVHDAAAPCAWVDAGNGTGGRAGAVKRAHQRACGAGGRAGGGRGGVGWGAPGEGLARRRPAVRACAAPRCTALRRAAPQSDVRAAPAWWAIDVIAAATPSAGAPSSSRAHSRHCCCCSAAAGGGGGGRGRGGACAPRGAAGRPAPTPARMAHAPRRRRAQGADQAGRSAAGRGG
jgi:hypothetical protein